MRPIQGCGNGGFCRRSLYLPISDKLFPPIMKGHAVKKSDYLISELRGVPVYEPGKKGKASKRVGKVHHFVFHPKERRVVGFTVKRPDIALMAHRSDWFVALEGFEIEDGHILIDPKGPFVGKSACKRLGISWDDCIMWQGLPLMTEKGERCGFVGDVRFSLPDGTVQTVAVDRGKTADILLGYTDIPASLIEGFKLGVGDRLNNEDGDDFLRGAIIVSPEVLSMATEGGLAERAGAASAVVNDKASRVASNVSSKVKPAAAEAAHKAGEAVNDGAYKLGVQLSKTKGMFSSFKEEYRRARDGEDSEE